MTSRMILLSLISICSVTASASVDYATLDSARMGQRILIVAPHVDDEALGAGGYASDAIAAGAQVYVVYLTAGDHSRTALVANRLSFFATASLNRKGKRRMNEARRAASRIELDHANLILLGYPDRGLRKMFLHPDRVVRSASTGRNKVPYADALSPGADYSASSLRTDLHTVITTIAPDIVISTMESDHHPDHRAAATLVREVLHDLGSPAVHLGYRIHNSPTNGFRSRSTLDSEAKTVEWLVYPLTNETVRKKRAMLTAYRSQRRSPYLLLLFRSLSKGDEMFVRLNLDPGLAI